MSEYKFDLYSKIVSVCANVLVLGAVTLSMYLASFHPETHLSVFCSWFFGMLVPILLLTWLSKRLLRQRYGHADLDGDSEEPSPKPGNRLTGVRLSEKS